MGVDGGPFPTFDITEIIMISIVFGRLEVTVPLTNHSKHHHNHSFWGRLEVAWVPLTPLSNHFTVPGNFVS